MQHHIDILSFILSLIKNGAGQHTTGRIYYQVTFIAFANSLGFDNLVLERHEVLHLLTFGWTNLHYTFPLQEGEHQLEWNPDQAKFQLSTYATTAQHYTLATHRQIVCTPWLRLPVARLRRPLEQAIRSVSVLTSPTSAENSQVLNKRRRHPV